MGWEAHIFREAPVPHEDGCMCGVQLDDVLPEGVDLWDVLEFCKGRARPLVAVEGVANAQALLDGALLVGVVQLSQVVPAHMGVGRVCEGFDMGRAWLGTAQAGCMMATIQGSASQTRPAW